TTSVRQPLHASITSELDINPEIPEFRNSFPKGGKSLVINLVIQDHSIDQLTLTLDESYILKTNQSADGRLQAFIQAANFFGARHGLETLSQLIIFDDVREELQIARDVSISDQPAYPYRGILLDTSRNYITVAAIKNTLTGMAAAKLNSFHWHITDSHSFPYVSKSQPDLSRYGAYSRDKVYSPQDVKELIQFAKERLEQGIRVVPEFDAPAHVGEGWQKTGLVTCFNWQPWQQYCVEPPCGQFDVTKPQLYEVIAGTETPFLLNGSQGVNIVFLGNKHKQVLGAEATFWTEQADSTSLDSRLWPRASAMAEVLWSEPESTWRAAESRFLIHRERLVRLGVQADALEPEWCTQYEENCPIGGKFNVANM
ncbi:hypothetical protein HUJ04_004611, partial [Dendroctonus ponderosae]